MSSFSKFKISFVLCLALLFSFAFAGTITINGLTHTVTELTGDYTITTTSNLDKYILYYIDNPSGTFVKVRFFDENNLQGFDRIGYRQLPPGLLPPNGEADAFGYWYLTEDTHHPNEYVFCEPWTAYVTFNTSNLNAYNGVRVSPNLYFPASDFPSVLNVDTTGSTSYEMDYEYVYSYGSYYPPVEIYYSDYSIYEYNDDNTLGDVIYSPSNPGGIVFPPFDPSPTAQEINDNVYDILSSQVIKDQLPSSYSNFFVIYDEYNDYYQPFFFFDSYRAVGLIQFDENDEPYYNIYIGSNLRFDTDDFPFYVGTLGNYPVYTFYKGSSYNSFSTIDLMLFRAQSFSYNDSPVVYTNVSIPFYTYYNGVLSETPDFTLTYSDITDPNNNVVTAEGELSAPKTDDSIWAMLFNLFNPSNSSSNTMSQIEEGHNQIINNADYGSFNSSFDSTKSLIGDLSQITWLITANNLLFGYFSNFLILCCIFITISRVLR